MRNSVRKKFIVAIIVLVSLCVQGFISVSNKIAETRFTESIESGLELMENGYYQEAIQEFEEANSKYHKSDQATIYIAEAYFQLLDYNNSIFHINKAIEFEPTKNSLEEYLLLSDIYLYQDEIEKSIISLNRANNISERNIAVDHLKSIDLNKINSSQLYSYLHVLEKVTSYDVIVPIIEEWIKKNPNSPDGYNVKGIAFANAGYPYEAIKPFIKSLKIYENQIVYSNLLQVYFDSDRLFKCQELALKITELYNDDFEAKYYLAQTYILLNEHEKAIRLLEELLYTTVTAETVGHIRKEDVIVSLVQLYYTIGNEEKALEYAELHDINDTHTYYSIKYYTDIINQKQTLGNDVLYLKKIFRENYLYETNFDIVEELSGDITNEEAEELLNFLKQDDDPYTYIMYGENYNYYSNSNSKFEYINLEDDIHYIKFETFNETINYYFIQVLDRIYSSNDSTLIIDLRDNSGGRLRAASSILDNLIGETRLFTQEYKTQYDYHYESNSMKIAFESIYVLVNNKSASASEVLALCLKNNLDNVTIVGEQTYGKGVGQNIFSDAVNQRTYYIVSFYLNVGDSNIHGVGISPDVPLDNIDIEPYLIELLNLSDFYGYETFRN